MKRIFCLILSLLLLPLTGCSQGEKPMTKPSTFYYRVTDLVYGASNGIIVPETHETAGCGDDLMALMERYLDGPHSQSLKLPLPSSVPPVKALSVVRNGSRISVCFTSGFARLTGIDLTVACSCIAKTLFDYTDAEEVEILAQDALLDGSQSILLHRDSMITFDAPTFPTETTKGDT